MKKKMSREAGSARGGKKKIIFTLAILVLVFGAAACLKVQAGTGENGAGWLGGWSDDGAGNSTGLGWISMNSINCDINGDGTIDNAACISAGASGGIANYGLSIPTSDGNFSGPGYYAWSPNVGWVSFNPSDLTGCPAGTCAVQRTINDIQGWARIIGIKSEYEKVPSNSGGWQGWVKLNGTAQDGSPYGVSINGTNLQGYAWSDELGWIDFSKASIQACVASPGSDTYSCFDGMPCGACEATETTNYWICSKTDSCGDITIASKQDCLNEGINTCSDTTCPACPATSNWKEVAP